MRSFFATILVVCLTLASSRSISNAAPAPGGAESAPIKTARKPPYPVDHDAPLAPTERLVDEAVDHTRLRVEFNGIRKDRVPAYLYIPKDVRKTHPAVLLQYGSGGNKNTNYIVALGQQFVARGFVVLTIDSPNKGERKPKTRGGFWAALSRQGQFQWYCGDYSRAVDYLITRPEVDPKRVGYAGVSWGAITGVTFVAHDPRIKAMASIVGGGNFMGSIADKVEMPPEVVALAKSFDPVYHVGLITPRPLLLLNVTRDQLVPRFFADSLHNAAGNGAKKMWIDTDHFFRGVDRYAILEDVIDFMSDHLAAEPQS